MCVASVFFINFLQVHPVFKPHAQIACSCNRPITRPSLGPIIRNYFRRLIILKWNLCKLSISPSYVGQKNKTIEQGIWDKSGLLRPIWE